MCSARSNKQIVVVDVTSLFFSQNLLVTLETIPFVVPGQKLNFFNNIHKLFLTSIQKYFPTLKCINFLQRYVDFIT